MITLTCKVCSKTYTRLPSKAGYSTTCSNECRITARRVQPKQGRSCAACGKPLVQHADEAVGRFNSRILCGTKCRGRAKRRTIPERTCPVCMAPLKRKPYESACKFARRLTCGRRCGQAQRSAPSAREAVRHCEYCTELIPRRSYQTPSAYAKVKYCSRVCTNLAHGSLTVDGVRVSPEALAALAAAAGVSVDCVRHHLKGIQ